MQNDKTFCPTCSTIYIRELIPSQTSIEPVELGSWEAIQERAFLCNLCHTISTAVRNGPRNVKGRLRADDELLLTTNLTGSHITGQETDPKRSFRLQLVTDEFDAAGDVLLHADDAHLIQQEGLFHGRILDPIKINTELVKNWISDCVQSHPICESKRAMEHLEIAMPEQSMLIDVHKQCIIDAPSACSYAALSYVWGDSEQFLTTERGLTQLRRPGDLSRRALPQTVRDAITLTADIGMQYLWVDALCIMQDSDDHKAKQISRMQHIYGGATVTIVAVASENANDGLHGVGNLHRSVHQDVITVDGIRLFAQYHFLDVTLNRSEYQRRAWTYQESCLSRRLLYVTATGVAMQCCQSLRSEELVLEEASCKANDCVNHTCYLDTSQRNLWRECFAKNKALESSLGRCACRFRARERYVGGQLPIKSFGNVVHADVPIPVEDLACKGCLDFDKEISTEFHTYRELVRGYTYRQMRYESDRVAAFAGIAGLLSNTFGGRFFYGLPEKYFDAALLWRPTTNRSGPGRTAGLKDIPSWSWASYEVGVGYNGDSWLTSEVDWYFVDEEHLIQRIRSVKYLGNRAPFRDDFHQPVTSDQLASFGMSATSEAPMSTLYGWCQISTCFYVKDSCLYDENKDLVDYEWNTVNYTDYIPRPSSDFVPVELCFISRSKAADLDPRVVNTTFKDGDWDLQQHNANFLIIETTNGVSKRVAIAYILNTALWKRSKKQWRLVKLV